MKKNLEILEWEPKKTKADKEYTRFKTQDGWMSCFDTKACEELKKFKGNVACVEVAQSGDFQNIKKCYGEAENEGGVSMEKMYDEKPEVVKIPNKPKQEFRTPEQMIMCEMTCCAKDVFCAMCDAKYEGTSKEIMDKAITLVKQAKEAFE